LASTWKEFDPLREKLTDFPVAPLAELPNEMMDNPSTIAPTKLIVRFTESQPPRDVNRTDTQHPGRRPRPQWPERAISGLVGTFRKRPSDIEHGWEGVFEELGPGQASFVDV
jgi:hypothetical protein